MRRRSPLWLIAGFAVWSAAFLALYGVHALGCALDWDIRDLGPTSMLRTILILIWAVHLAVAGGIVRATWPLSRDGQSAGVFVGNLSAALGLCALLATLWVGLPVFALPTCEQ